MLEAAAILLTLWLATNVFHRIWIAVRYRRWERGGTRGADGLLQHGAAYTEGHGDIALLFVHGFADTPMLWKKLIAHLTQTRRFTCQAMRLPGAAEPLPSTRRKTLTHWQAAVDAEVAALRATHRAVWVIGHSMGGALAIDVVQRATHPIHGLILLAPLIQVSRARMPLIPPHIGFKLGQILLALSPTFESYFTNIGTSPDDPTFQYVRDRFIPFATYRNMFALVASNAHLQNTLTLPVFAAVSGRDRVVDSDATLRWLTRYASAAKIEIFGDAGHVLPLKQNCHALADTLSEFIKDNTIS